MLWLLKTTEHTGNDAEKSQPRAEFLIGHMYANGLGVEQDYEKAMEWYLKVEDDAESQFAIAELFANGRGISQSYPIAAEWYAKAARNDLTYVKVALADLYASGQGVPQNDLEAMSWYLRAANSFDAARFQPGACDKLFAIFERGKDVPEDGRRCVARRCVGRSDEVRRRSCAAGSMREVSRGAIGGRRLAVPG
jgi:TPR repeat protein